jgi:glycine/D-amino acid oxidase-like deaminating enzyme
MVTAPAPPPRIVVVGGGIIGLTSALALVQRGFRSVRVVAESFDDLVSHVAGAIWMPFALPNGMDPYKTTYVVEPDNLEWSGG